MSDSPKMPVRVRYAPSPTGYFHIGAARTVLFNWLFARQHKGQFIIRIEDTDKERSRPEFERDILESIAWLGLDWDEGPLLAADQRGLGTRINADKNPISVNQRTNERESAYRGYRGDYGPYRQSERLDIYEKYLTKLLDEGKAYYCFCTKEQLENDRQAMMAQGLAPKYSGRCRTMSESEGRRRQERGESSVIRLKMPETEIAFTDIVRGKVKFDGSLIGDAVLAKDLRSPLFNFASPIDDIEMKITHVIRGEELLPSTPKQIALLTALGFPNALKYAHLPLILTSDRRKMSKRYMDTALAEYRRDGYLAEAIINFVVLLGWHPAAENVTAPASRAEQEIFSREELIQLFDLGRVQKAGAVFNAEKLDWFNERYVRRMENAELRERLQEFLPSKWLAKKEELGKVIAIEKDRLTKLSDFRNLAAIFFELPGYSKELLLWPRSAPYEETKPGLKDNLRALRAAIENIREDDFSIGTLEMRIMPLTESRGRGEVLWPLRVAVSGREASPGPFEIMEVLGKDETLRRIDTAISKLP